jgi:hypothetical protein
MYKLGVASNGIICVKFYSNNSAGSHDGSMETHMHTQNQHAQEKKGKRAKNAIPHLPLFGSHP